MHNQWNNRDTYRYNSCSFAKFIIITIRYNKHYTIKFLFSDISIINCLDVRPKSLTIIFMRIFFSSERSYIRIQALFKYINFPFFLENAKREMADC